MNRFNNTKDWKGKRKQCLSHHRVLLCYGNKLKNNKIPSPLCCVLSRSVMSYSLATQWTVAHQASLSMGILQARILERVAMPFSKGSSESGDQTQVSCIAGGFFRVWATRGVQEYLGIMDITHCENWKGCCLGRYHHLQIFTSSSASIIIYCLIPIINPCPNIFIGTPSSFLNLDF